MIIRSGQLQALFRSVTCLGAVFGLFTVGGLSLAFADDQSVSSYPSDYKDECYKTPDCYSVVVGSAQINSSKLSPYHAKWTQSSLQNGEFQKTPGGFEESLSVAEDGNWVHIQTIRPGDGTALIGTRRLDHATLEVLDLTLEFENMPSQPAKVFYELTGNSFAADITFADGKTATGKTRSKALPMFDGQIAGLTLAALPLAEGYTATLPMIIPNLGVYWIEASVIGRRNHPTADGRHVAVWEVNANWLNLSDGDIYAPGKDGSGGVYFIAIEPGDGIPHVVEYVNNGGTIQWDGVRR